MSVVLNRASSFAAAASELGRPNLPYPSLERETVAALHSLGEKLGGDPEKVLKFIHAKFPEKDYIDFLHCNASYMNEALLVLDRCFIWNKGSFVPTYDLARTDFNPNALWLTSKTMRNVKECQHWAKQDALPCLASMFQALNEVQQESLLAVLPTLSKQTMASIFTPTMFSGSESDDER